MTGEWQTEMLRCRESKASKKKKVIKTGEDTKSTRFAMARETEESGSVWMLEPVLYNTL